jgi:hypothetical protein
MLKLRYRAPAKGTLSRKKILTQRCKGAKRCRVSKRLSLRLCVRQLCLKISFATKKHKKVLLIFELFVPLCG